MYTDVHVAGELHSWTAAERERERERQTDRQTERQRDTERHRERQRHRQRVVLNKSSERERERG